MGQLWVIFFLETVQYFPNFVKRVYYKYFDKVVIEYWVYFFNTLEISNENTYKIALYPSEFGAAVTEYS